MAELAVELADAVDQRRAAGVPGQTRPRILARGDGWTAADVLCTCGPQDRPYEEQHVENAIAIVLAGTFEYHSATGRELMTAGSLLLGNPGHSFECRHRHGEGDRCVSLWYAPEYFERLAADAGLRASARCFNVPRVPALRELSPLVAHASAGVRSSVDAPWEELAITLAVRALRLASGISSPPRGLPVNAEARVARAVRIIDRGADASATLSGLAREVGLSPYHFLRSFKLVVGVTPHQYVLRARMREAAWRLARDHGTVLDVAFDSGFGDVSNFNHAFRAEFGMSPRVLRRALTGSPARATRDGGPPHR